MKTLCTIRNCPRRGWDCPVDWDALPASDPVVRNCPQCGCDVHLCTSDDETIARGRAGDLVAREVPDDDELPPVILDGPLREWPEEQRRAEAWFHRERGIDIVLKALKGGVDAVSRTCPECSYPVPDERVTCPVCGWRIGRAGG